MCVTQMTSSIIRWIIFWKGKTFLTPHIVFFFSCRVCLCLRLITSTRIQATGRQSSSLCLIDTSPRHSQPRPRTRWGIWKQELSTTLLPRPRTNMVGRSNQKSLIFSTKELVSTYFVTFYFEKKLFKWFNVRCVYKDPIFHQLFTFNKTMFFNYFAYFCIFFENATFKNTFYCDTSTAVTQPFITRHMCYLNITVSWFPRFSSWTEWWKYRQIQTKQPQKYKLHGSHEKSLRICFSTCSEVKSLDIKRLLYKKGRRVLIWWPLSKVKIWISLLIFWNWEKMVEKKENNKRAKITILKKTLITTIVLVVV